MIDINDNHLLNRLRDAYPEYLSRASSNGWVLFLPNTSIDDEATDRSYIRKHVYKPSPYYQGQFISLDGECISIQDDQVIHDDEPSITILCRDSIYTDQLEKIQVFVISRSFAKGMNSQGEETKDIPTPSSNSVDFSLLQSGNRQRVVNILNNCPDSSRLYEYIDAYVKEFYRSYILVKEFIQHAGDKIKSFIQSCISRIHEYHIMQPYSRANLILYLCEYLYNILYEKIYSQNVRNMFKEEDMLFHDTIKLMNVSSMSSIGVIRAELCTIQLSEAISKMKTLDEKCTPLSIMNVLVETSKIINEQYESLLFHGKADDRETYICTADDIIPIFAYIICASQLSRIKSVIVYVDNFYVSNIHELNGLINLSEFEYYYATFKAAVELIPSLTCSVEVSEGDMPTSIAPLEQGGGIEIRQDSYLTGGSKHSPTIYQLSVSGHLYNDQDNGEFIRLLMEKDDNICGKLL